MRANPRRPRIPGLAACWLLGLLAWRGADSAVGLVHDGAAFERSELSDALHASPEERARRALGPLGTRLSALLTERTPPEGTVFLVAAEERPATLKLWLGLYSLLFPRVILLRYPAQTADLAPGAFVLTLGPVPERPWAARAEHLETSGNCELWRIGEGAR